MKTAIGLYALLALLVIPVFPHFPSPNEFTRWALVVSVVDDHTVEVSRAARLLGPRFEDLAVVGNRVYSNKAPGTALVAAPGYLLVRPFIGPPSRENLRVALTAMRWFGATLPLLALAFAFACAARARGGDPGFATAALLFATPLFAYGMQLFSHALVAAALFGAWLLLFLRDEGGLAAGALIGIAVMSEYPVVIVAAVFLVALAIGRAWKRLALVIAGGIPFAAALAWYQRVAFGSALRTPYGLDKLAAFRQLAKSGVYGVQFPSLRILGAILFDPARGLLLFSPILIAGIVALPVARRALPARAFATLIAAPLALLAIYAGYPNWHGGWNVGPRYVVAIAPFVLFPLALTTVRAWHAVLFGISAAAVTLTTLAFPFPPNEFPLPWGTLAIPLMRDGLAAPNLFHFVARPLAIAVPLLIVAAAIACATPPRLRVAAAAGIAIALSAAAIPRSPLQRIETMYIEAVYFEHGTVPPLPGLVRRAGEELPYGPASWPF